MEGLVDPRVFESHAGLLVGVALLALLAVATAAGYLAEALARRKRESEHAPADVEGTEQTKKAA